MQENARDFSACLILEKLMNLAVIDLGTNTFNLLVAEVDSLSFKVLHNTKKFVQLGKGGINHQILQQDAIKRAMETLAEYRAIAEKHNCDQIKAIATSAVRNADNGQEFIEKVYEELGISIEVIDGDREAAYIYEGAKNAVALGDEKSLIMDVGGGSTEFIICDNNQIYWKQSFEVGAARLYEKFHHSEPIKKAEISAIQQHLEDILAPLIEESKVHQFSKLIGCSGAFTSFAAVILCKQGAIEQLKGQKHYRFPLADFHHLHHDLIRMDLTERLKLDGLIHERAPMIVVGSILVNFILTHLPIKSFELSRYALKEGVGYEQLNKM